MRRLVGLVMILLIACFSCVVNADDRWDDRREMKRDVRATRAIEGRWNINANNHMGTLELSRSGNQYSGRVYFDDYQRWETLTNIQFDDLSGTIGFDRPEAKQHYAGRLINANTLEGSFSGGYRWQAKLVTRDVRATRAIEGRWNINANNHMGTLELSWSGNQYSGRVYFDDYQRWETLTNIQFDDLSGTIGFDRPEAKQHYAGRLINADTLEGSFSGGYRWQATRM